MTRPRAGKKVTLAKLKRPMDARRNEICAMPRDNLTVGDFWILTDGYNVTIAAQKAGESATGSVSVPRAEFNRMIRWYVKPVAVRKGGKRT